MSPPDLPPPRRGPSLWQYLIVLALVAVVVIVILALIGPSVGNIFSNLYRGI